MFEEPCKWCGTIPTRFYDSGIGLGEVRMLVGLVPRGVTNRYAFVFCGDGCARAFLGVLDGMGRAYDLAFAVNGPTDTGPRMLPSEEWPVHA